MTYYRKVEPQMNNPFEKLIESYVNGTKYSPNTNFPTIDKEVESIEQQKAEQKLPAEIRERLKWILPRFKQEFPTTPGYHMAFVAGRSLYLPDKWSLDWNATAVLWDSEQKKGNIIKNQYIVISKSVGVGDYNIPSGVINNYFPVMLHLAYASDRKLYGIDWLAKLPFPKKDIKYDQFDYFPAVEYYEQNTGEKLRDFPYKTPKSNIRSVLKGSTWAQDWEKNAENIRDFAEGAREGYEKWNKHVKKKTKDIGKNVSKAVKKGWKDFQRNNRWRRFR